MERIEIRTRFSKEGAIIPLDFSLGEHTIMIRDIGRQWQTEHGQHILVMDDRRKTYHLFFQIADLSWYLIRDLKGPASPA